MITSYQIASTCDQPRITFYFSFTHSYNIIKPDGLIKPYKNNHPPILSIKSSILRANLFSPINHWQKLKPEFK